MTFAGDTHSEELFWFSKVTALPLAHELCRDLAERACGVDKGDGTECKGKLWLQEMELLCEESHQHNGNTENNIPIANGLPLEGEWTAYASGKVSDSECDADVSNELTELLMMTVELDEPDCSVIPCVYLGGMQMQLGHANELGDQVDASGAQMDSPSMSNKAETDVMGHREGARTYLATGDTKCIVYKPDGCRNLTDGLTMHTDAYSIEMETEMAANEMVNVSTHQIDSKMQNSPYMNKIAMFKCAS